VIDFHMRQFEPLGAIPECTPTRSVISYRRFDRQEMQNGERVRSEICIAGSELRTRNVSWLTPLARCSLPSAATVRYQMQWISLMKIILTQRSRRRTDGLLDF
jgi:hypothetical protein